MVNRRTFGLGAAFATLAPRTGVTRARKETAPYRLQTRLFNFKDDASPEKTAEVIGAMKALARSSGVDGFLMGRNFIPVPFPTRFEWLYMVQFDDLTGGAGPAAFLRFEALATQLSTLCRNEVECDLSAPAPPRFADAAGVAVRHTVMFDFKPEASPEDRARNVGAIRTMGKLPMVQSYRVEESATYLSNATQMQWQVIGDFASLDDYNAYSKSPVHLAIRDDFKAHTSRVAFLDVRL